ncbi:MAG TPA: hypothetical protein VD902_01730, partial [Symbiobacteriaceae bacterium]|nr:hypothetical protein [Symbiobacteriaceae bacterium]
MKRLTKHLALFLALLLGIQTSLVTLAHANTLPAPELPMSVAPSRVSTAAETPVAVFAGKVLELEQALAEYETATDLT